MIRRGKSPTDPGKRHDRSNPGWLTHESWSSHVGLAKEGRHAYEKASLEEWCLVKSSVFYGWAELDHE